MKISGKNIQNKWANILFVLVAFPYISIINFASDTQPYALIYSVLFVFVLVIENKKISLPYPLWIICLILFYANILYFINADFVFGLRSLAGYSSIFFIAVASYLTFKYLDLKSYFLSISIWTIFGIIQFLFKKDFGYSLIVRMSTSPERGVTSLAVEPSYYAIMCMFFLVFNEIFYQRNKYNNRIYLIILFILLFQIFISYSGMGLVFITIFFAVKIFEILKNMSYKGILKIVLYGVSFCSILGAFAYIPSLQITRAGGILSKFMVNPLELLFSDASMADRASHIVIPLYSLIFSHGMGLGLGTWSDYGNLLISSAGGWVEKLAGVNISIGGRIMSGWGTAVYELGVVGVLLILVYLWLIFMASRRIQNKQVKANLIGTMIIVFIMLLMAVPLAMPFFGYILGVYFYYVYNLQTE